MNRFIVFQPFFKDLAGRKALQFFVAALNFYIALILTQRKLRYCICVPTIVAVARILGLERMI